MLSKTAITLWKTLLISINQRPRHCLVGLVLNPCRRAQSVALKMWISTTPQCLEWMMPTTTPILVIAVKNERRILTSQKYECLRTNIIPANAAATPDGSSSPSQRAMRPRSRRNNRKGVMPTATRWMDSEQASRHAYTALPPLSRKLTLPNAAVRDDAERS